MSSDDRSRLKGTRRKCCGSAGSPKDKRRLAEVAAIKSALQRLPSERRQAMVIGGDINLVGSRDPLDRMAIGLDADGSDLTVARTRTLGDRAFYTWRDADSAFPPGRRDWLLYSDSTPEVLNAFALDTERLSDASLAPNRSHST